MSGKDETPARKQFTARQLLWALAAIIALNQSLQLIEWYVWPGMPLWISIIVLIPSMVAYCVIPYLLMPHLAEWAKARAERRKR